MESGSIGFTTGGAQDIENFRANLNESYLPLPSDITFTGIIKDYYFDTSSPGATPCTDLFCPIYSLGLSPQPAAVEAADGPSPAENSSDIFMAVGLDSGIQASDFKRKKLNLVLVLDVSGSMGSPFDEYYYDQYGQRQTLSSEEQSKMKIDVAKEVLTGILGLLHPEDRVSIVLFSDDACTPLPLGTVGCLDMAAVKKSIQDDVMATYSTNTAAGIQSALDALHSCEGCVGADPDEWENRIILMTDAETNQGMVSDDDLKKLLGDAAAKGIFFTIVGIGLDFQTTLVDLITQVPGANYFSVHSEFQKRLVSQFDYAVTPLVFDLQLALKSSGGLASDAGWRILEVYGSSNNDTTLNDDGTIMTINTLFPSPKEDNAIKGGVILVRLHAPTGATNSPLELAASYKSRQAYLRGQPATVVTKALDASAVKAQNGVAVYQSSGVRKAILLARYTDLIRSWLVDQWVLEKKEPTPIPIPVDLCPDFPSLYCPTPDLTPLGYEAGSCSLDRWVAPGGCILPVPDVIILPRLGEWERQSAPLQVSDDARAAFEDFLPYFEGEVADLGDSSLDQETNILKKLIAIQS